jgi:hypothetical protein
MLESGWRSVSEKYHEELRRVMAPRKNEIMRTAQIAAIIRQTPGMVKDAQFIYPSDHCVNHTNAGACFCAMTDRAIFKQISRGIYLIL